MTRTPPQAKCVEYVDLDTITSATRNPKGHQLATIRASIARFGFVTPAVIDERTTRLVVGHGRTEALRAMRDDGETPPAGVRLDGTTWQVPVLYGWASRSDAEAEAYLIADNQNTIAGGWDEAGLSTMIKGLHGIDPTLLDVTGFSEDQLAALMADPDVPDADGHYDGDQVDEEEGDDTQAGKGALLSLVGATVGDPDYPVATGDIWRMGDRLILAVANPHTEWQTWVPLLTDGALLLPYPSPLAAVAEGAVNRDVVFVQPNKYIAGWLLTKWARVTGGEPIKVER